MELMEAIKNRYSVRSFSNKAVEQEKIEEILAAGRLAPTACNIQPQKILVLKTDDSIMKWKKCNASHFNEQLVMIVCYDKTHSWKRQCDGQDSGFVDASIVTTHMMLEATELGLGSTWVMDFNLDTLCKEFNIPDYLVPVSVLVMGYPAEDAAPSRRHPFRKPFSDLVEYETFGK